LTLWSLTIHTFATKSFDIHLDLIWFLIPMFVFRRLFERHKTSVGLE